MNYINLLEKLGFQDHPHEREVNYKVYKRDNLMLVVRTDLNYMEVYKDNKLVGPLRKSKVQVMIALEKYL